METMSALVDDLKRQLDVLTTDYYVNGAIDRGRFFEVKGQLDERLAGAESALATVTREQADRSGALLPGDREGLEAWWKAATPVEQRDALRRSIHRVVVNPAAHRGGNKFQTDRISIEWSQRVYFRSAAHWMGRWDAMTPEEQAEAAAVAEQSAYDEFLNEYEVELLPPS
jgi:hypothetical protein